MVYFWWGNDDPAPNIPVEPFSVLWTGEIEPRMTREYRFEVDADGGVRLWLNGQPLIDDWTDPDEHLDRYSPAVPLVADQHYDIVLEYFNVTGEATVRLYWWDDGDIDAYVPTSQLYPASFPATSTITPTLTHTPSPTAPPCGNLGSVPPTDAGYYSDPAASMTVVVTEVVVRKELLCAHPG